MKNPAKYFKYLTIVISLFFIALFYYISLSRITYPFELEWMEGGSVDHLERVIQGKKLYTAPSVEYIPYIYTPLYYYTAIPLTPFFGITLLPLRIVSLLSTSLIFILLFLFLKKETGEYIYGVIASGLFAAVFSIGGAWYDLARVDMLFILLFLCAFYFLRFSQGSIGYIIAAIFGALSFLTKQTASLVFLPVVFYLFFYERKKSWFFNIPFLTILIGSTIYFTAISGGWYYFWNFTLPADHRWTQKVFILFWTYDLIKPLSILLLLAIVYFYFNLRDKSGKFYIFLITGTVLASYLSRLHYGGYANVLLPAYLSLIIIATIAIKIVIEKSKKLDQNQIAESFIWLIIACQFVSLLYSPKHQIPSKETESASWKLVSLLKHQKGDVYVMGNTYFARLAGKKVFTHSLLIWDLLQSTTKYNKFIEDKFNSYLKNNKFDLIIDYAGMSYPYLDSTYIKADEAFKNPEQGWAVTGYTTRPNYIYYPKK